MPSRASLRSLLGWSHAVFGAALAAFVVVHLVQCWSLVGDPREHAVDAASRFESGLARGLAVAVLALLGAHAVSVLLGLRAQRLQAGPARALARVQIVAGVLAASFTVYHVIQVRVLERGPHRGAWDGYAALLEALGQPIHFAAYVVGVTAVCYHVAFGAARFTSGEPAGSLSARIVFGVLGMILWALWLQPLARLATGAALF